MANPPLSRVGTLISALWNPGNVGPPETKLSRKMVEGLLDLFVRIRFPRFVLMGITAFLAYGLFHQQSAQDYLHGLGGFDYAAAFVGGALFAMGFGAPFGVAILAIIADDVNILLAAVVGGLGSLSFDIFIFRFVKLASREKDAKAIDSRIHGLFNGYLLRRLPPKTAFYIAVGVAGLAIAMPLTDEIGVSMLACLTTVSYRTFAVISFALNTLGILAVLAIGFLV